MHVRYKPNVVSLYTSIIDSLFSLSLSLVREGRAFSSTWIVSVTFCIDAAWAACTCAGWLTVAGSWTETRIQHPHIGPLRPPRRRPTRCHFNCSHSPLWRPSDGGGSSGTAEYPRPVAKDTPTTPGGVTSDIEFIQLSKVPAQYVYKQNLNKKKISRDRAS